MFNFTTIKVPVAPVYTSFERVAGLSDSGYVVGSEVIVGSLARESFSFSIPSGTLVTFAQTASFISNASDVNNSGEVVGEYLFGSRSNAIPYGYLYSNGTETDLSAGVPLTPGYIAYDAQGITDSGTIVGFFFDSAGEHGFIRIPGGTYNAFDVPAAWTGHNTEFVDVNDNSQVVGTYFDSGNVERSFEYNTTTGSYAPLIFSGDQTVLTRINDLGEAIGSYTDGFGVSHGLLFDGSTFTVIDDPLAKAGGTTLADINDQGQIVGSYLDSSGNSHGFLYSGGSYQTIDEPLGVGGTQLDAINDFGQIAGTYNDGSTQYAFYAVPVPSVPVPYDLNGDGISDLVFQNNGAPGIWLWNGSAPTAEIGLPNPGPSWHIVASRDVNGDGMADLIWQNSDGTPGIWLMNGTTPIAEAGLSNPGSSWHLLAAGDVNGDGNADLIWQDSSGTLGVWEMNGTTPIAQAAIGNPGANWKVVGTADYNGDGRDDILLQDTATGNLMIDLMNGTSVGSTKTITVGDPSWHAVSTGEFNGQAVIAWQGSDGTPGIWLMNATAPAAEAALSNPGAGWQLVSVDHFTPSTQADLLFQNTSGAMMLWEMNGTSVATTLNLPNPGAGWQLVNGHPFAIG